LLLVLVLQLLPLVPRMVAELRRLLELEYQKL
jgi:hypothetical protein